MNADQLERYFARIGYRGPRTASLPVLHALTAAHAQSIPFENLDVLLERRIDLSDDALFDKLVVQRRGGYCFEQNGLFLRVLQTLGFAVTPLSARGRIFQRAREITPPRTHLFLQVELDGTRWFTDVGVGALSLTAALHFELDTPQVTPHDTRRIVFEDNRYYHQVLYDTWTDVYEFTGEAMPKIDCEVSNWFTSAHPQSHFKNQLIVARPTSDGRRYTIHNTELKIREHNGESHVTPIEAPETLLALLQAHFGLHLPANTRFGNTLWQARAS
ncbi:MAG: arylamine N-acetyltransferase [Polyangiales bacterium]